MGRSLFRVVNSGVPVFLVRTDSTQRGRKAVDNGGMLEEEKLGTREQGTRTNDLERRSVRRGDDIAERLLWLGAQVLNQMPTLDKTPGAENVARQLERCATSHIHQHK